MTRLSRQVSALIATLAMLVVQTLPAYAVCACEVVGGDCCGKAPRESEPSPMSCCVSAGAESGQAAVAAGGSGHGAARYDAGAADHDARTSIVPMGCTKSEVDTSLSAASVPGDWGPHVVKSLQATGAMTTIHRESIDRLGGALMRGPPPRAVVPLFLLHVSFRC